MFIGGRKGPEDLKTHLCSTHSVGDPDPEPDPQDPHGFGPPGSEPGSISQRYGSRSGSGSRSLPFSHKCVEWTEIMLPNEILTQNFSTKLNFLD